MVACWNGRRIRGACWIVPAIFYASWRMGRNEYRSEAQSNVILVLRVKTHGSKRMVATYPHRGVVGGKLFSFLS
jgi:hypothetical protein